VLATGTRSRQDCLQLERRARGRVAFAGAVRFLDERIIVAETAQQGCGGRDDPVEDVDAEGEIGPVHEGAPALLDHPAHCRLVALPSRGTDHDWHARGDGGGHMRGDRVGH
jgi:hypothetical protein